MALENPTHHTTNIPIFSPDGKTLVYGSGYDIKVLDMKTKKYVEVLKHEKIPSHLEFSPDGKILAAGLSSGSIIFWDTATWNQIRTLKGHTENRNITSTAFSPDGKTIGSASGGDNKIILWDVETGEEITALQGHESYIFSISFSQDGKLLASSSADSKVIIWNVETGEQNHTISKEHMSYAFVNSVLFSPDGRILATKALYDILLWEVKTMSRIAKIGHITGNVQIPSPTMSFSPDGSILSCASGNTIKLYRVPYFLTVPNPDFNSDGLVTIDDFFMFAENFGTNHGDEKYDFKYDLNHDRKIGLGDFWIFAEAYGK